jgi:hypothetical protein
VTVGTLRRHLGSLLPAVLVGLALAGLLLGPAGLPHTHSPWQPGFYNQEHDFSYLATVGGVGPVSDTPAAAPLVVVVALAIAPAMGPAPSVGRRHADFRAPPLS